MARLDDIDLAFDRQRPVLGVTCSPSPIGDGIIWHKHLAINGLGGIRMFSILGKPAKKRKPRRWGRGGVWGSAPVHWLCLKTDFSR